MRRTPWPLLIIAAPAAVAIWSGWVALGQLAGFGMVQPLPGILPWHLDTAITLPIGIEAYGAYALGVWLSGVPVPSGARQFARWSAIGALGLGMTGQVASHLLMAAHVTSAPWPVTVLVSCVPVVTLGFAAALTHLLRAGSPEPAAAPRSTKPATLLNGDPAKSREVEHGAVTPVTPVTEPSQPVSDNKPRFTVAADPELFTLSAKDLAAKRGVSQSTIQRDRRKAKLAMANGKAH